MISKTLVRKENEGSAMEEFDQKPLVPMFDPVFAENSEERCPCLLLLDTSHSMSGEKIQTLNEGLQQLKDELLKDSLATKRVELALVTFGPVELHSDFTSVPEFYPPQLQTTGMTPMGEAIERGLDLLKERKAVYKANGVPYFRPWVLLITDGEPTDNYGYAKQMIESGEANKEFVFFPVAVDGANMTTLADLSVRQPLKLRGLAFRELFSWLSSSLGAVSASSPGEAINLPPTDWAVID